MYAFRAPPGWNAVLITSSQIRAARAIINAKQSELAKAAGISLATLNNIERGVGDPRTSTLDAIERALPSADPGVGVLLMLMCVPGKFRVGTALC